MKNTKGISSIIATLILLLLTIVLVGIVWAVVSGIVKSSTEGAEAGAKCFNSAIEVTAATCTKTTGKCNVTIQRTSGTDVLGGVRVVFFNKAKDNSSFSDIGGDIPVLGIARLTNNITNVGNITEIDAYIYFLDSAGDKSPCTSPTIYTNIGLI